MSINDKTSKKNDVEVELLRQRGARFALIKEKLGFKTLEDFGKALADKGAAPIDKSTLSKMERGLMAVSKKILVELSSKYNVNTNYLLYGVGDMIVSQAIDNQSNKTKIGQNSNEQLTNGLDLQSTKSETDMYRLINALEKIANANEMLAATNSELAREVLATRNVEHEKKQNRA